MIRRPPGRVGARGCGALRWSLPGISRRLAPVFVGALSLSGSVTGAAPLAEGGRGAAPALLIVAGVGGSPEHRERFSGWAHDLCAAVAALPVPAQVRVLVERPPEGADDEDRCAPAGRSTEEELSRQIAALAGTADGGLVLILLGHGTGGGNPRFQLPGPDLSPERLREMLEALEPQPVTIAHLGSAAGAFVAPLSGAGRVVLAASRAHETNETRFARHFIASFAGEDADRNKDGSLSALEAFEFARVAVEREYESEGLLRSEHALLDDNGDGVGSLEPEMAAGSDGVVAGRRPLLFRTAEAAGDRGADSPELRELVSERDELVARVDALREARSGVDEETYLAELERLLLRIAEISERIAALRETPE